MRTNENGSLLVEALLSVVILSVSITLIIQSMASSLRATVYNGEYTNALFLMENKLFDIVRKEKLDARMIGERQFDAPFEKYQYSLTTEPVTETEDSHISNINVGISWQTGRRDNHIEVDTFALNKDNNEDNQEL